MVMGIIPIASSLAFQLSGGFSKMVAIEESDLSLQVYGTGFGIVALLTLGGGYLLHVLNRRLTSPS